jgi:uncharacterized membrane protein
MLRIKIIGAEDKQQKLLLHNVSEAVRELDVEARIITITDWQDIVNHDLIHTPALIVRNQVISQGFVPAISELKKVLLAFLPQKEEFVKF